MSASLPCQTTKVRLTDGTSHNKFLKSHEHPDERIKEVLRVANDSFFRSRFETRRKMCRVGEEVPQLPTFTNEKPIEKSMNSENPDTPLTSQFWGENATFWLLYLPEKASTREMSLRSLEEGDKTAISRESHFSMQIPVSENTFVLVVSLHVGCCTEKCKCSGQLSTVQKYILYE